MKPCPSPLSQETLVAYWAGDLDPAESDTVEEHLFSCESCTNASARVAAVTETLRKLVPPIVSPGMVQTLQSRGFAIDHNLVVPDVRSRVRFTGQDFIIHHLSGLSLDGAARVDVSVRVEQTGDVLVEQPAAPFDAEKGEVLIACQRHFASFPPDIVFEVTATDRAGTATTKRYVVSHEFAG